MPVDKGTILVVDDDYQMLDFMKRTLRKEGYEVQTTNDPTHALTVLNDFEIFDVVISDYKMPKMDGVTFLSAIKNKWPKMVRMMLTGHSESGVFIPAIRDGTVEKYVSKPCRAEDLTTAVSVGMTMHHHSAYNQESSKNKNSSR